MLIELSSDNLSEIISTNSNVVAIYGAPWCENCRILKPHVKKLAESDDTRTYVYVNAETHVESRSLASVRNLPCTANFIDGSFKSQTATTKIAEINEMLNKNVNQIEV